MLKAVPSINAHEGNLHWDGTSTRGQPTSKIEWAKSVRLLLIARGDFSHLRLPRAPDGFLSLRFSAFLASDSFCSVSRALRRANDGSSSA